MKGISDSDSAPRIFPVRPRVGRRGRDLERFLNLWRIALISTLTVTLLVAWLAGGTLALEEEWGLGAMAVMLLAALAFQLYLVWFPWHESAAIWVVGADLVGVTGVLLLFVVVDRAVVATNSQIAFFAYFLVVALAGIRGDPRVARSVALAVPLSYALVVFLAVAWREAHFALPDPTYGAFRWHVQVARLLMLAAVTWVSHADVALGTTDRAQAQHDPLTGLYNRRFLEELLARELPRAQRLGQHLSVLLLDLDGFKEYNDTHGHLAGDHVLEEVAVSLANAVRGGDTLARFGGDEFVVVMPSTSGETARRVARELIKIVPPEIGLSVGVGCLGAGARTVEELLVSADVALRRAKQAGGGVVEAG